MVRGTQYWSKAQPAPVTFRPYWSKGSQLSHVWLTYGEMARVLTMPASLELRLNAQDTIKIAFGLEYNKVTHECCFVQAVGMRIANQWRGWNWQFEIVRDREVGSRLVLIRDRWGGFVCEFPVGRFTSKTVLISERMIGDGKAAGGTPAQLWLGPEAFDLAGEASEWLLVHAAAARPLQPPLPRSQAAATTITVMHDACCSHHHRHAGCSHHRRHPCSCPCACRLQAPPQCMMQPPPPQSCSAPKAATPPPPPPPQPSSTGEFTVWDCEDFDK